MVCLHALVVLCILSSVNGQCPELKFPSIGNGDTYSGEDGVLLDLNFEIDTKERKIGYTIVVSKQDTEEDISKDICKMLVYSNGTCYSFRPAECKCDEQQRRYSLVKTLDKSDDTFWKWKVESEGCITAERKIRFNIQDSPSTKRPPTTLKTSDTTVGPKTTKAPGTGTDAKDTTTNTKTDPSTDNEGAASPLVIGIVIAVVVLVVIIAIVATVLAVRRRKGLPLFRRASGQRDPINFRRPDSKMPEDNQEGYLYPTSLTQTAPEEVLDMTPRPPPRTAINPEYEFEPQSGTMQRFEV